MEISEKTHLEKESVHKILAHSYFLYLFFLVIGIFLDFFYKVKVFSSPLMSFLGLLFLIFGTILILWAQNTSRSLKTEIVTRDTFTRGPYLYTRSPTHIGLAFLMLGFGLINNSFFVVLLAFVSFIVSKLTFLNKEEKVLVSKYGTPYVEYKKSVRF